MDKIYDLSFLALYLMQVTHYSSLLFGQGLFIAVPTKYSTGSPWLPYHSKHYCLFLVCYFFHALQCYDQSHRSHQWQVGADYSLDALLDCPGFSGFFSSIKKWSTNRPEKILFQIETIVPFWPVQAYASHQEAESEAQSYPGNMQGTTDSGCFPTSHETCEVGLRRC